MLLWEVKHEKIAREAMLKITSSESILTLDAGGAKTVFVKHCKTCCYKDVFNSFYLTLHFSTKCRAIWNEMQRILERIAFRTQTESKFMRYGICFLTNLNTCAIPTHGVGHHASKMPPKSLKKIYKNI